MPSLRNSMLPYIVVIPSRLKLPSAGPMSIILPSEHEYHAGIFASRVVILLHPRRHDSYLFSRSSVYCKLILAQQNVDLLHTTSSFLLTKGLSQITVILSICISMPSCPSSTRLHSALVIWLGISQFVISTGHRVPRFDRHYRRWCDIEFLCG